MKCKGAFAIRPSGLVVSAWTRRQAPPLSRTSEKNGNGHQSGYGQMSHRSILTDCGGVGKVYGGNYDSPIKPTDSKPFVRFPADLGEYKGMFFF